MIEEEAPVVMWHAVHHGAHGRRIDVEDDPVGQPIEAVFVEAGAGVKAEWQFHVVWRLGGVIAGGLGFGRVYYEVGEAAPGGKIAREELDVDFAGIAVVLFGSLVSCCERRACLPRRRTSRCHSLGARPVF